MYGSSWSKTLVPVKSDFGSTLDLRDELLLWHPPDVLEHPLVSRPPKITDLPSFLTRTIQGVCTDLHA